MFLFGIFHFFFISLRSLLHFFDVFFPIFSSLLRPIGRIVYIYIQHVHIVELEGGGRGVELLAQGIRPCDSTQGVWPRCETLRISRMMGYIYIYLHAYTYIYICIVCIYICMCGIGGNGTRTSGVVPASLNL